MGTRLADKIWEIAESGELRKLNEFNADEDIKVIELFTNVWGAGAHTARQWFQQVIIKGDKGGRTFSDSRNGFSFFLFFLADKGMSTCTCIIQERI